MMMDDARRIAPVRATPENISHRKGVIMIDDILRYFSFRAMGLIDIFILSYIGSRRECDASIIRCRA